MICFLRIGDDYLDDATRFGVKHSELREAYDEWTSITHNPEGYL